ncbi:MAG: hypothetical protein R2749_09365 [Acidimicrobiales bacterium]
MFDVLRRQSSSGRASRCAATSNITDIDDKIIERASSASSGWQEITTRCESIWYQAMWMASACTHRHPARH